jgi:hypothetical protein
MVVEIQDADVIFDYCTLRYSPAANASCRDFVTFVTIELPILCLD